MVAPLNPFTRTWLMDSPSPVCSRCSEKGKTCTYNQEPLTPLTTFKRPKRKPQGTHVPIRSLPPIGVSLPQLLGPLAGIPSPTPTQPGPTSGPLATPESSHEYQEPYTNVDQKGACYTAHGRFSRDIAAAIDERAGIPSTGTSNLVPFVNAPLFGDLDLRSSAGVFDPKSTLPSRAYADRLVGVYWNHVDPTEPVLDRELFFQDYKALYSAAPWSRPNGYPDTWLSILNVVFALSVQRLESIALSRRCDEANQFFRRAWALLGPETILWHSGSVDIVQCLMLMSRYLHCTNNRHLTWMTAGLAARIAQSTCCQPPERAGDSPAARKLRRRVWESCLHLDR